MAINNMAIRDNSFDTPASTPKIRLMKSQSGWFRFESSPRISHNRVGPGLCRLIRQSESETSSGSPVHLLLNPIDPLVTSLATNFITLLVTASKISEEPVVTGTTVELVLRIIIEDGFDAST